MAVTFSAGNRWQGTDLTIADSKTFTLSVWFKQTALASQVIADWHRAGISTSHGLSLQADGDIAVSGRSAAGTSILSMAASSQPITANTWHHVLVAVDLAGSEKAKIYLDGTKLTVTGAAQNSTIDFSTSHFTMGAGRDAADDATLDFAGVIDEFWFSTTYLDPDDSDVLGRFVGPDDEQIGLGHFGRNPLRATGTLPEIFLTHGAGNFGRNEGSAQDLVAVGSTTGDLGRPAATNTVSRGFRGERWRESERSGIPFPDSQLVSESASSGLEVGLRELSTDRDELNRRQRHRNPIFEY
jgi:hypothetical protein